MDQKELKKTAESCVARLNEHGQYDKFPYKHLVVDDFLPAFLAEQCLAHFPKQNDPVWEHETDSDIEIKSRTTWQSEFDIPDYIVDVIRILNSSLMLTAMSDRFGIPKLIPDLYFRGGGLNEMKQSGLLGVHVDGNHHEAMNLNRRMNALLYLNPGWQPSWGGCFGLYDERGAQCIKRVAPLFNRLVVFDSHDTSYHGLPDPLNMPDGKSRKSIILYYYTSAPRPGHQIKVKKPHSALWVDRGHLDKRGNESHVNASVCEEENA